MGFDAFFFCRLDIEEHLVRLENKAMEFIWHGAQNTSLFTSILFFMYATPPMVDFDLRTFKDFPPIVADK